MICGWLWRSVVKLAAGAAGAARCGVAMLSVAVCAVVTVAARLGAASVAAFGSDA